MIGVLAVSALAGLAWWLASGGDAPRAIAYAIPGERVPYRIEVLNGAGIDGLARDVTRRLRRGGLDVVYFGSAPANGRDSTVLIVRRGDSAAGVVVRGVLGFGRVLVEPDPRLLLDVTVLLGADAVALDRDP